MLIKHWALLESIADAPEKTALVEITNQELPQLLDRIDTLMARLGARGGGAHEPHHRGDAGTCSTCTIGSSSMLPSLESYSDPFIHMERNDLAEEGGPLGPAHAKGA